MSQASRTRASALLRTWNALLPLLLPLLGCGDVPQLHRQGEQARFGAEVPASLPCYRGRAGEVVGLTCDMLGHAALHDLYRRELWLPHYEWRRRKAISVHFGRLEKAASDAENRKALALGSFVEPHLDLVDDVAGWDLYDAKTHSGMMILSIENRVALVLTRSNLSRGDYHSLRAVATDFVRDPEVSYVARARRHFPVEITDRPAQRVLEHARL